MIERIFYRVAGGLMLCTCLAGVAGGARAGHEGALWLKSTLEGRRNYAIGYVLGFSHGVQSACIEASKYFAKPTDPNVDPLKSCLARDIEVPDTDKLAKSVTDFYRRYPSDRYLYITDVMAVVGRGMTLDEIHRNAGPVGVRFSQTLAVNESYVSPDGFVPERVTAVRVAEAVLVPIYGEKQVTSERPFSAELKGGIWTVRGHLPEGWTGGVAEVRMSKKTGEVISVSHGK